MAKYFNEEYFNKGLREFFEEHKSRVMVRIDDIGEDTVTLTFGFGDGKEFYMTFGSTTLAKGWKVTIESPEMMFNLADFVKFSSI